MVSIIKKIINYKGNCCLNPQVRKSMDVTSYNRREYNKSSTNIYEYKLWSGLKTFYITNNDNEVTNELDFFNL